MQRSHRIYCCSTGPFGPLTVLLVPNTTVDVWSIPLASDRATDRLWRWCIGCVGAADGRLSDGPPWLIVNHDDHHVSYCCFSCPLRFNKKSKVWPPAHCWYVFLCRRLFGRKNQLAIRGHKWMTWTENGSICQSRSASLTVVDQSSVSQNQQCQWGRFSWQKDGGIWLNFSKLFPIVRHISCVAIFLDCSVILS